MGCKCEKINNEIQLAESIQLTDLDDNTIIITPTNTCFNKAIVRDVRSITEVLVLSYIITVYNYKKLTEFIEGEKELKEIEIDGSIYHNFTITKTDKNIFKIIIND